MTPRCAALALPILLALAAPLAFADEAKPSAPAREEAATRFGRGVKLLEDGNFPAALGEFEAAYKLAPRFQVLYNIGYAQAKLFRYDEAVRSLRRYLDDGATEVPREKRASVEREIAELVALCGEVRITVAGSPARIEVDGHEIGLSPREGPLLLGGGRHVIRALREGDDPAEQAIEVVSGAKLEVKLAPTLHPITQAAATLVVHTRPSKAMLFFDGRPIAPSPWQGEMDPGGHRIEAKLDGHAPASQELTLVAGQTREISLELSALRPSLWTAKSWRPWVTAAATVLALGAAGGTIAWIETRPNEFTYPPPSAFF